MTAPNAYALDRRNEKIRHLIAALDLTFLSHKLDDPELQLLMVEAADALAWVQVASTASTFAGKTVHPPHEESRDLIVAEFRARAQRAEVAKAIAGALRAAGVR